MTRSMSARGAGDTRPRRSSCDRPAANEPAGACEPAFGGGPACQPVAMTQALGAEPSERSVKPLCLSEVRHNVVLLVRDRDCGPSPLARRQFVGYRELRELQLSV